VPRPRKRNLHADEFNAPGVRHRSSELVLKNARGGALSLSYFDSLIANGFRKIAQDFH